MEGLGLPPPELTEQELEVVTTVFRNYETGLREATIFPKVGRCWKDNQTLHGLEVFKMPKFLSGIGGYPPPLNGQSLCSKKLSGKNPLKRF